MSGALYKLHRGFTARQGITKRLCSIETKKPIYWFQVASSGEFEQALPIMESLKKAQDVYVLLTYFSPSAEKAIELETERRKDSSLPWDYADYSPWEIPWKLKKIAESLRPKAFISIHREIWPFLLKAVKAVGTKTYLFSSYWPEESRKRFNLVKRWLPLFDFIGTVSKVSTEFLKQVVPQVEIQTIGDSRVDRVLARKKSTSSKEVWTSFFPGEKNFVGASLWEEDFKVIKELIEHEIPEGWRLILVPHDPKNPLSQEIYEYFKKKKIKARMWSSWIESPDTDSHIIVNQVGFLAELYKIAQIVLVGGSFKSRVHNVLEPAVYGCPILTGPYIWNSNDACEMAKGKGLVVCKNGLEFSNNFLEWTIDLESRKEAAIETSSFIEKSRGAAEKYSQILSFGS